MKREELFPRNPTMYREGRIWKIYDNSFSNYQRDFMEADGENKIEKRIQSLEEPVIVDLMGSTYALFTLEESYFRQKKKKKLIAVGMEDGRTETLQRREADRGIIFLQGNLNTVQAWEDLTTTLADDKADIIMERGYGGLYYVPTRPLYHRIVMHRMWDMLRPDGGLLVVQTPPVDILEERGVPIHPWLAQLQEAGIDHEFSDSFLSMDGPVPYGMLLIQKDFETLLPDIWSN